MRNIVYSFICFVLFPCSAIAQNVIDEAKPESFEFHVVNADIFFELFQEQTDFYDLFYQKTSEVYSRKLYDQYYLLQLYLRAGLPGKARAVLEDIAETYPNLTSFTASNLYTEVSKFSYPQLSSLIIDTYGHIIVRKRTRFYYSGMESYRCFDCLRFFRDLQDKEGWSLLNIEEWIEINPKIQEFDKLYLKMLLFVDFNAEKRMQKFTKELAQKMYLERDDIDKLLEYLQVICFVRYKRFKTYNIDLSWIEKEIQLAYSTDALRMSECLGSLGYSDQLEYFIRQAISIELQAKDYTYLNSFRSRRLPGEILRVSYLLSLNESLSKLMLSKGEKEEAHALMMTSLELSKQNHIKPNMVFAGQTQGGVGIYRVEEELLDKEKVMVDSIEYWNERYHYYVGREDMEKSEYALLKGIDLLKIKYSRDTLHFVVEYQEFVDSYCWVLGNLERQEQALELYLEELTYSVNSQWSHKIIGIIERFSTETEINPWEDVFWEYLGENDFWPSRFLSFLIRACNNQDKELMLNKLASLARGSATRSYNLAVYLYDDYPERSITYFEFARFNYPDDTYSEKQVREDCTKRLVKLYVRFGNLEKAELTMLQMESKYVEHNVLTSLRSMALSKAKNGDYSESMRLWSLIQNINPSDLVILNELYEHGMSKHLKEYYLNRSKKLPESINSENAMKYLDKR